MIRAASTDQRDDDGAMRKMDRSLKLLATDRIDPMLHQNLASRAELARIAGPDGAEKAIRSLVDRQVIRFRGFSCHDPTLTLEAIARLEPDASQATITATRVADFESEVLPLAEGKGIAVVAMKTVLAGMDSQATLDALAGVASAFTRATSAQMTDINKRAQVPAGTGYWIPRPA